VGKIIIVVSNVSHFHGSLPIAEGMRRHGHEILYYIGDDYNGSLSVHDYPVKKISIENHDTGKDQAGELHRELRNVNPALIILDIDLAVYLIFTSSLHIPTVLLNFFVPFHKQRTMPPFYSSHIPRNNVWSRLRTEFLWLKYFCSVTYIRRVLIFHAKRRGVATLFKTPDRLKADYKRIFPGFKGHVEIHTGSPEFNFGSKMEAGNFYLGHVVSGERLQPGAVASFDASWSSMVGQRKLGGEKIVLCAFGGYSGHHEKECLRFYHLLIALFEKTHAWKLVLAIGTHLDPGQFKHSGNVMVTQVVPQLHVLEQCDAMITHGGMNSINEGIATGTPMLVYPLNKRGDQPGNAARVEFHRIGIRGNIRRENALSISEKLTALLTDAGYKTRISALRQKVISQKPLEHTLDYLQQLAVGNTIDVTGKKVF
jgi:zeaxanthin glucosyltransferase